MEYKIFNHNPCLLHPQSNNNVTIYVIESLKTSFRWTDRIRREISHLYGKRTKIVFLRCQIFNNHLINYSDFFKVFYTALTEKIFSLHCFLRLATLTKVSKWRFVSRMVCKMFSCRQTSIIMNTEDGMA